ncbi:12809_t:CDS:2 [Cetraspora pellucida]|uniref:12809_t:CDS:1 n=1 Tax=Cetraspora pellucida TaxID=1433469 RepID=A0ACA9PT23_9GLOM|nr:12809_t:CDS:2 [Cetraspora pellucida]
MAQALATRKRNREQATFESSTGKTNQTHISSLKKKKLKAMSKGKELAETSLLDLESVSTLAQSWAETMKIESRLELLHALSHARPNVQDNEKNSMANNIEGSRKTIVENDTEREEILNKMIEAKNKRNEMKEEELMIDIKTINEITDMNIKAQSTEK